MRGYIYSHTEVLSEAGDPYWVSSTSEDKVDDKSGETTGNKAPNKVTVIDGATWRSYTAPWDAIELSKLSPELLSKLSPDFLVSRNSRENMLKCGLLSI